MGTSRKAVDKHEEIGINKVKYYGDDDSRAE